VQNALFAGKTHREAPQNPPLYGRKANKTLPKRPKKPVLAAKQAEPTPKKSRFSAILGGFSKEMRPENPGAAVFFSKIIFRQTIWKNLYPNAHCRGGHWPPA
jgi:hypothetical protein